MNDATMTYEQFKATRPDPTRLGWRNVIPPVLAGFAGGVVIAHPALGAAAVAAAVASLIVAPFSIGRRFSTLRAEYGEYLRTQLEPRR